MNLASRISGEGRAEFLRTWGPDFDQKGGGMGGKGGRARVRQVYLCVETMNILYGGGGMWRGGRALGRIDIDFICKKKIN